MPDPSRVLLVVAHGGAGGMQVQVGLLARGLLDAGCEVAVASGPGPLDTAGAPRHELPALDARGAVAFGRALADVVVATTPGIVHAHGLRLSPFLAGSLRRRALVTCHGVDPDRLRRTAAMVRLTRVHVAACGEGPRRLLAASGVRSRVLNNAVAPVATRCTREEVAARFGLDASSLLLVAPARLTEQKDPVTLVRAVARVAGVSCVLAGGGPLEDEVRREVARLGLEGRVVVTGWLDDARAVLAGADALALASVWEGQPTVVLEAMVAGVAVVATSCAGTVDTVVDGVSGLLATPRDPASLAGAIRRALDAPTRARLAAAGRAQVVDHDLGIVAREHLAGYRRVLAGEWP